MIKTIFAIMLLLLFLPIAWGQASRFPDNSAVGTKGNGAVTDTTPLLPSSPFRVIEDTGNGGAASPTVPLTETLINFTSWQAEIRKVDGHWELWAGAVKIKELGNREADAREVLRLIRVLNLNQLGTVGKPLPVMEYWLSDGRAPQKMGRLNSIPIDPESLQVANCQGQWCLVDEGRPWFTFGAEVGEARRALQIIQKYQFTDILYVGVGNPVMIVFLAGSDKRPNGPSAPLKGGGEGVKRRGGEGIRRSKIEDRGSGIENSSPTQSSSLVPRSPPQEGPAQWFQPPQLHVNTTLAEPVTGNAMVHFDWRQAAVRRHNFDWQVIADGQVLAQFGSRELEARQALRAVQTLQLTDRCQVGEAAPALTFFLSNGEPAHGLFFGAKNELCHPGELSLKRVGLRWMIWEFDRPLLALGKNQEEAQQVLQILQHYKVDHICQIGTSDPLPVTIFVRTR